MTTVGIHQPGYLPWIGFFKKIMNSEIFVFFDDVKFVKKDWYNRNQIPTKNGPILLTVPVMANKESLLNDVKINNNEHWSKKHKKSILYNYGKHPYFEEYRNFFEELYEKEFDLLIDLNMEIIYFIMKKLNIKVKTLFSSELNIKEKGAERVLKICTSLPTTHYISGTVWAKNHLNLDNFEKAGIKVEFQNLQHPKYHQPSTNFIPNMSIIDLLFNEGPNAKSILKNSITD